MQGAITPPTIQEVVDYIHNTAYTHATQKMQDKGFLSLEENTLFIRKGASDTSHITLLPDGTVETSPELEETPLVNFNQRNVFSRTWDHLTHRAHQYIQDSLDDLVGPHNPHASQENPINELLNSSTIQTAIKLTADHAAVVAGGSGYIRNPAAVGYHLLYQLLGKQRVAQATKFLGHNTTLRHFNLIQRYPEVFQETLRTTPNAATWWLGTPELAQNTPPATAGEMIAQARGSFINLAARRLNQYEETPDASMLWRTFLKLNHTAVTRLKTSKYKDLFKVSIAAQRAGVTPSYTATMNIADREWPVQDWLGQELLAAYAAASVKPPGRLTQRQLSAIMQLVAEHTDLSRCVQHEDQCLQASQDLQEKVDLSRTMPRPLPLWELIRTYPQDLLDPSKHTQDRTNSKPRRNRTNRTKQATPRTQTRDVLAILQDLPPEVIQDLARNPVTIEETPGARMALKVQGQTAPTLEVARSPEGTITVTSQGYWTSGTILKLGDSPEETARKCRLTTRGLVAKTVAERVTAYLKENWQAVAGDTPLPKGNRIPAATRKFLRELGPSQRDTDDQETDRRIGQALETIINQRVVKTLEGLNHQATLSRYNTIAGIIDDVPNLQSTNPGLLQWGLQYLDPTKPIRHPGQFVTMVKQHLEQAGLQPRYRRFVIRMPNDLLSAITSRAPDPRVAAGMCNALARAQAMPGIKALEDMLDHLIAPWNTAPEDNLRNQNLQQTTFILARDTIDQEGAMHKQVKRSLSSIMDYVLNTTLDQQKVNSTTWNGLQQASEAWHREQQHHSTERRWRDLLIRQGNKYRAWNSLLPQTELQGLTCIPLTSEEQLYLETDLMKHCVYSYGPDCAEAKSRIFSIRKDDQHIATTELRPSGAQWKVAQTRAKHNHDAPEEAHQVANLLALNYTQAQRNQQQPHREWWVNTNTGELAVQPANAGLEQYEPLPF